MNTQIQFSISIDVYERLKSPDFIHQELETKSSGLRMLLYVSKLTIQNRELHIKKLEQEKDRLEQEIADVGLTLVAREAEIAHCRQLLEDSDIDSEDESTSIVH